MAKKGEKKHLKRLNSPAVWQVARKKKKWSVDTSPGPHSVRDSLPLTIALRETLGLARTKKEVDKILGMGAVKVDGKERKDSRYPVGLMDVLELTRAEKRWRVLFDKKGYLKFQEIDEDESGYKLTKVIGKTPFKGNRIQLSLHDGKTLVGDFGDVSVGDTIKVSLPDMELENHIARKEGCLALITGGSNVGKAGRITSIQEAAGPSSDRFLVEAEDEEFQAPEEYVFVIGEESSEISLPEGD